MLCPIDKTPLVMSERQNIEIDYCPTCRGVWLDRGELDKIIERSAATEPQQPQQPSPKPQYAPPPHYQGHGYQQPYGKRKKGFLEELFD
jgi:Zn-finger nucleic acid-binding protein